MDDRDNPQWTPEQIAAAVKRWGDRPPIQFGDRISIAGINRLVPNPRYRWWSFWRPRMIDSGELQSFTIRGI